MAERQFANYKDEDFAETTGLAHIRAVPTFYLRSLGTEGVLHCIRENLDNSVDELTQIPNGQENPVGGTIHVCIFKDKIRHVLQILLKDDGRGFPPGKFESGLTKIGSSAKRQNSAYTATGGQFGVGAKAAVALSTRYRALSKNFQDNRILSLCASDGVFPPVTAVQTMDSWSGVYIAFELDVNQFFKEATDFYENGAAELVSLCRQLNMFNECINFQIYMYDRKIPDDFWSKLPGDQAVELANEYILHKKKDILYSSADVEDKMSYLFDTSWRTNSSINFSDTTFKHNFDGRRLREFTVKMFITKRSATGNIQCFAAVNNVALKYKNDNSVSTTVIQALRDRLAVLQPTPEYKDFVLNEYRFTTMLLASDVRYNQARLAGATKDDFKSSEFEEDFRKQLDAEFDRKPVDFWTQMYNVLKPDIEARYAQYYDTPVKKSDNRKTFLGLNFVKNFKECDVYDDRTELYLVEGNSASSIVESRDVAFQAVYTTRGKPKNGATSMESLAKDRKTLLENPLYQDLMHIIGVNEKTKDISTAKVKKIIIATDADPDGLHIAALHLHNFSIINPLIVSSGMVWIAKPPLYSIMAGHKSYIFLRNKAALYDKRIELLYKPNLKINIKNENTTIKLDDATYRETCYAVHQLGEDFVRVASQLSIPVLILERFVYALRYLYPTLDYLNLAKCFASGDELGYVQVRAENGFIIVSLDNQDYVVGLQDLGRMIADNLLKSINKFRYNDLFFEVTPKGGKTQLMSPMMLYLVMEQLDKKLTIERFKGLGQMPESACYATIMNPATRAIVQIHSLGDLDMNYALVGTSDSESRKQILSQSAALSNTFVREFNMGE